MTGTFEKVKKGISDAAHKVTDSDTYTGSKNDNENRDYNQSGGKEPMNPKDIAEHEPTAIKRDENQGTSGDPV